MHLPLLNALDPYALSSRARRDKAPSEPFIIESALEKPRDGRGNASGARPDGNAPEDEIALAFEDFLACAFNRADDALDDAMPEEAIDGQGLCALLEAAATA